MALQLPKINLTDAKTRVIVIFGGIVGFVGIIYAAVHFLSNKTTATSASHVAGAPGGLQSVPGGQLTPEYYRALVQANTQAAKQAKISGGSAVPTLLNQGTTEPAFQQPSTASCTVVCPTEENVNVENDINDLVKAGKLSVNDGKDLVDSAKKNVAVSQYAAYLDQLVKQGKLSPEQARKLLDDYKKQHENIRLQESGQVMDGLIKSGQLPIDLANELLDAQKKQATLSTYATELSGLAGAGKISQDTAGQLLAQYTQQHAKEGAADAIGQLESMVVTGQIQPDLAKELEGYQKRYVPQKEYDEELQHLVKQHRLTPEQAQQLSDRYKQHISPEVAAQLVDAQKRNVPVDAYEAALNRLVAKGKISPEQAKELLSQYRQLRSAGVLSQGVMTAFVKQAEQGNENSIQQIVAAKKISPAVARKLIELQQARVPIDEYQRQLEALVEQGKISVKEMQALLQAYKNWYGLNEEKARLDKLQVNQVPVDEYINELKQAVANGLLTPDQAAQVLKEYQESKQRNAGLQGLTPAVTVKGGEAFAELQKRVQATAPVVAPPTSAATREQFSSVAAKTKAVEDKAEQERIQALMGAMSTQAGQLISSWQPPTMTGQVGAAAAESKDKKSEKTSASSSGAAGASGAAITPIPLLIKAGSIIYAVLDTAANSDFPDSPVLATIVQGKFKGAKLLGKLAITKDQDRVSLTFQLMNMDDWASGKTINAYAIDPDTARTALASNVNYHYFLRYGGLFASSFVQGYASAISNSGSTTSSGIFGTTTTHAVFSPANRIMTGLGQVGQTLGQAIQGYTNTPPTVKIDPGVSLGILFMQDVAE